MILIINILINKNRINLIIVGGVLRLIKICLVANKETY